MSPPKSYMVCALTLTLDGFHQWSFITAATLMLLGKRTTLLLTSLQATSHSFPVGHHKQVLFIKTNLQILQISSNDGPI